MTEGSGPTLETGQTFAPPSVRQFSVFMDNKVGKLYELLRAFDHSPVQVCAINVHDASDHAVVRLVTSDAGQTRQLLLRHRLAFAETDLLIVELSKGHTLERLCLYLLGGELNIRFAYPLITRPNGTATIAIAVDDIVLAGQILRRKDFRLFGENELGARGITE